MDSSSKSLASIKHVDAHSGTKARTHKHTQTHTNATVCADKQALFMFRMYATVNARVHTPPLKMIMKSWHHNGICLGMFRHVGLFDFDTFPLRVTCLMCQCLMCRHETKQK